MTEVNLGNWDEDRYVELNTYFRVKIRTMLESDPYLQELAADKNGMQLDQLIDRMSEQDQNLWIEFLELDRIKLHLDMKNHLEGKGNPYSPQHGFSDKNGENNDKTW